MWFDKWFGTPYYKLLYSHRNHEEAREFLKKLLRELKPENDSMMLDLACGRGRHSVFLAGMGYNVTGIDYDAESIKAAKRSENNRLQFFRQDMREPFGTDHYDYIFNLFTSFGYFDTEEENLGVMRNIYTALHEDGKVVIDFMNAERTLHMHDMKHEETVKKEDITFSIHRYVDDHFIKKDIYIYDGGKAYHFQERVMALTLRHFKHYFDVAGLELLETYGDYDLNSFDPDKSDRLIMIAQK